MSNLSELKALWEASQKLNAEREQAFKKAQADEEAARRRAEEAQKALPGAREAAPLVTAAMEKGEHAVVPFTVNGQNKRAVVADASAPVSADVATSYRSVLNHPEGPTAYEAMQAAAMAALREYWGLHKDCKALDGVSFHRINKSLMSLEGHSGLKEKSAKRLSPLVKFLTQRERRRAKKEEGRTA